MRLDTISGIAIITALIFPDSRGQSRSSGFNTLADLQMLGLEYQHKALAVSQNTIKT
jgi:hypothetical protein